MTFLIKPDKLQAKIFTLWEEKMSGNNKTQPDYMKPSRADMARSVATSTAVETGQPSAKVEASLEAARKKYAHLYLA